MTTRGKSMPPSERVGRAEHLGGVELPSDEPARTSGFYISTRDDPSSQRVLVVEGDPEVARATSRGLRRAGEDVTYVKVVSSLDDAPSMLRASHFDAMLVNVDGPSPNVDMERLERALTLATSAGETAVIATGHSDKVGTAALACRMGAQDYLELGHESEAGLVRMVRCACERARRTYRLIADVYHDELTSLPNRRLLRRQFAEARYRATRCGGQVALLMIDLDGFKAINDTMGHAAGDVVLVTVAARLRSSVREYDVVARVGGDEFVVLASGENVGAAIDELHGRIKRGLDVPMVVCGRELTVHASIGAAVAHPDRGCELATMLQIADQAMYLRKSRAR